MRGGAEPVDAAISLAEKARRTARARSVAALFMITFLLACAGIPAEGSADGASCSPELAWVPKTALGTLQMSGNMSNIAHHCDIYIGNMQLKMKEILQREGCGISVK